MGRRHGKPAGALSLSQLLEREGLVPGVLPAGFIATIPVEATFGEDLIVDPGDVVPVDKLEHAPEFLLLTVGGTKLYSVIMVDLDHPDRDSAKPEDGQLANMIVTNIPAKEGSSRSGDVVLAYGAPSRYIGTGDHRYLIVACEQTGHIALQAPRHRVRFDLAGFLTRYHLTPVGATFLVGQHTKQGATPLSVPTTG